MSRGTPVHIFLVTIDVMIPFADSLKSKRRIIKSIKDRVRSKFNVSVSEMDYHDEWKRALIGLTMINSNKKYMEQVYSAINRLVEEVKDIQLVNVTIEWL